MTRVSVLGARGQLGAAIVQNLKLEHEVSAFDRSALDITDAGAVLSAMQRVRPHIIINCAAYNAVDAAEDHPVDALQANAMALRYLSRAAIEHDATLVHYSTDFVFDGTADRPYTEDDRPNPRSVYASSKLLGEWFATDAPRYYVLRVESLFGRAPGAAPAKGSAEGIVRAIRAGSPARVFEDRTVTPSYVLDVASATRRLLELKAPPGIYHCVNAGSCLWIDFAREVARQLGIEAHLEPIRVAGVSLKAERPQYCALSIQKLTGVGVDMPTWQDALARHLRAG